MESRVIMKKLRLALVCVLALIDIFLIIITAGYLSMAVNSPNSLGGRTVTFTGNYMLFGVYCLLILVVTIVFVVSLLKLLRKK